MTRSGQQAPGVWARFARAMYRDFQNHQIRHPSVGSLALSGLGATISAAVGALLLTTSFERSGMLRHWPRTEAEIVAVLREYSGKGGPTFDLRLRATLPDGFAITGQTIERHPLRTSWSEPRRPPEVGDRLTVLLDPADHRRMATAASLGGATSFLIWSIVFFAFAAFSAAAFAAAIHIRRQGANIGTGSPGRP